MRFRGVAAAFTALALVAAPALAGDAGGEAQSAGKRFTGYLWNLDEKRVRCAGQGNYHGLVLIDRRRQRTRYKLRLIGPGGIKKVWRRRTKPNGRGEINASRWINDVAGPGVYGAIWRKGGRPIAGWEFRVVPEFGPETCP